MELFEYDWSDLMKGEIDKPYFKELMYKVSMTHDKGLLCPNIQDIYRAFGETPFSSVKVVILGQDPYHNGNADGLAFSCKKFISPSLASIYTALGKVPVSESPISLDHWAKQGVFLLNTCLTTERGIAGAHANIGWRTFTAKAIVEIAQKKDNIVFMLWGSYAHNYALLIKTIKDKNHLILKAEHPAAASYRKDNWASNDCFNMCNNYLRKHEKSIINW
jgi:uracil-DNA glycosylase